MSKCPECAQILAPDAVRCPRCGNDLHARRLPPERRSDRDEQADADELLAAAIATEWRRPEPSTPAPSAPTRAAPGR